VLFILSFVSFPFVKFNARFFRLYSLTRTINEI
jgi:hypothetical protein